MAPATSLSYTYCTQADVEVLLSVNGETARLDDDAGGSLSATESGYLTRAIAWATARINLCLLGKHSASDLADSWIVNQWCSIVAAYIVSCRRGNPVAASLKDLYDEAMEDLRQLQRGEAQLPDTALRSAAWPAWSNVRVDILYRLRRARVEKPISETRSGQPQGYTQNRDVLADHIIEPN